MFLSDRFTNDADADDENGAEVYAWGGTTDNIAAAENAAANNGLGLGVGLGVGVGGDVTASSYQNSASCRRQEQNNNATRGGGGGGGIDYGNYLKEADSLVASNTRL